MDFISRWGLNNLPYLLVGASPVNFSPTSQQGVFLGTLPQIPDGELKHLRDAQFWLRNWTLNPTYFKKIVQGHRFSSHCLLLTLLGVLLWICSEKEFKSLLWIKRHSYCVCNKCSLWGEITMETWESLWEHLWRKWVALDYLVSHRNCDNSKIISSFISVISYIPSVLGFLLNRGDQDLQVHPKKRSEKEIKLVTLIFTLSLDWRCNWKMSGYYLYSLWSYYSWFSL